MPNYPRILSDMLLRLRAKRYSFYFLLLYYIITVLSSSLFVHSYKTMPSSETPRRYQKREQRIEICSHPCPRCPSNKLKYTDPDGVSFCLDNCNRGFHSRDSATEGSSCIRCVDPSCSSCHASPWHCDECFDNHVIHKGSCSTLCPINHFRLKGKCVKKCPKGYRRNRKKRSCLKKGSCQFTQWIPSQKCHCLNGIRYRVLRREKLQDIPCRGKVKKRKKCKNRRPCNDSPRRGRKKPNHNRKKGAQRNNNKVSTQIYTKKSRLKTRQSRQFARNSKAFLSLSHT